jgi:alanyl-tRNA synthetase
VLKIIDRAVVLDRSVAYPTSGGQIHDIGTINSNDIVDVIKQGPHIIHLLKNKPSFSEGDKVSVKVDRERRSQLAQHHTATHILNVAARIVLGNHINQAGAKKDIDKAHLDVTHFQSISKEELDEIEDKANEIIQKDLPVNTMFLPRAAAEKRYGMRIYQGGAVPGKQLRIVEIPGFDVEACGGTHLNHTAEVGVLRIIKATKIQDGIVRITFTAGPAADQHTRAHDKIISEAMKELRIENPKQLPENVGLLFTNWKKARKLRRKGQPVPAEFRKFNRKDEYDGDIVARLAAILKTQPEHIVKTIRRFKGDLK